MTYLQQGDVILESIKIPSEQLEVSFNHILQHGEHTGHKHALRFMHDAKRSSPQFEVLTNKETGSRYLKIGEPADLVHEEHKTIAVPPGEYEIRIVREYDHFKEEAREVVD
jgi:hypothetical protein